MKKIPTLFDRDWGGDRSRVLNVVLPEVEWVLVGDGIATRKRDGTATLVEMGRLSKRYDAKRGRVPPPDFRPAQDPDEKTGHWPGWLPVDRTNPADWMFSLAVWPKKNGTYEFCGPRIGQNPERLDTYTFFPHGGELLPDAPREYEALARYFAIAVIEGIVWHHPDGRMAKIKRRDFGFQWPLGAHAIS